MQHFYARTIWICIYEITSWYFVHPNWCRYILCRSDTSVRHVTRFKEDTWTGVQASSIWAASREEGTTWGADSSCRIQLRSRLRVTNRTCTHRRRSIISATPAVTAPKRKCFIGKQSRTIDREYFNYQRNINYIYPQ